MNYATFDGRADTLAGDTGPSGGTAIDGPGPRSEGAATGLADGAKKALGVATEAVAHPAPAIARAKTFARDRPWATAALVGTIGLALYNTLRGRR